MTRRESRVDVLRRRRGLRTRRRIGTALELLLQHEFVAVRLPADRRWHNLQCLLVVSCTLKLIERRGHRMRLECHSEYEWERTLVIEKMKNEMILTFRVNCVCEAVRRLYTYKPHNLTSEHKHALIKRSAAYSTRVKAMRSRVKSHCACRVAMCECTRCRLRVPVFTLSNSNVPIACCAKRTSQDNALHCSFAFIQYGVARRCHAIRVYSTCVCL